MANLVEIKRRTKVIDDIIRADSRLRFRITSIEAACLQLRKVLELIAFGSLIANVRIYSAQYRRFAEHWNATYMLKDMARVNSNFYPTPIIQRPSTAPGTDVEWADRPSDYLTKEKFLLAYEKCGAIMHAENPFGKRIDCDQYEEFLKTTRNQIVNLLNSHYVTLVQDERLYLFQMGNLDSPPTYHVFNPIG